MMYLMSMLLLPSANDLRAHYGLQNGRATTTLPPQVDERGGLRRGIGRFFNHIHEAT